MHAQADILPDAEQAISLETLVAGKHDNMFASGGDLLPEIGPTRTQHWLRVPLPATVAQGAWILRVTEVELHTLCIHWPIAGGAYTTECTGLHSRQSAGRPWHSDYLFDVPATVDTSRPLYVRAQSNTWLTVPLEAMPLEEFMAQDHHGEFQWGLYHGALLALIILTFLAWLDQRGPALLLFAAQHLAFLVTSFGWQGRPMEYANWPAAAWWTAHAPPVALAAYVLLGVLLHQVLLNTRARMPRLHTAGKVFVCLAVLAGAAGAVLPVWGYWVLGPLGVAYVVLVLAYDLWGIRQGIVAARFTLISIAIMLAAVLLKSVEAIGLELIDPRDSLTLIRLGALVSGLFMLIALGADLRAVRRDKQRAEDRLLRRTQELEDINVELLEFSYVASHDLKEPLRGISSFAALLSRNYSDKLDDTGREYLGIVSSSAKRANQLIVDLMEYSEARNKPLETHPVDSRAILNDALHDLADLQASSRASVQVGDMPTVGADADMLHNVLYNLLDNAMTHTAAGRTPQIHVACAEKDGDWKFSVRDNGPGISDNNLRRIFTLFHRQDRQDNERTGVGLALCKKAIQRHGGRIWVEQNGDEPGVTVYFTIPTDPTLLD